MMIELSLRLLFQFPKGKDLTELNSPLLTQGFPVEKGASHGHRTSGITWATTTSVPFPLQLAEGGTVVLWAKCQTLVQGHDCNKEAGTSHRCVWFDLHDAGSYRILFLI